MVKTPELHPHVWIVMIVNILAFLLAFLHFNYNIDFRWMLILILVIWVSFFLELFSKSKDPFGNIAMSLLGEVYIGLPFALFNLLAFKNGMYDFKPLVCLFIMGWMNDTGAYLFGVTLGRHKLYERISPKKTIEGFVGGVLATLGAAYCIYLSGYFGQLSMCIASAFVISIVGTAGDLIESMLKRHVNKKDSGKLLPGHGGALDRFDAILFSAPIVSLLYYFFT